MIIICHTCGKANPNTNANCQACGLRLIEDSGGDTPAPTPRQTAPNPHTLKLPAGATLSGHVTRDASGQASAYEAETAKLGTTYYSLRIAQNAPVGVAFTFPRVLAAGFPSTVYVDVRNLSMDSIEQVEIKLESNGLEAAAVERTRLVKDQVVRLLVSVEPARAGLFVLQCTVKVTMGELIHGYIGTRTLRINAAPRDPNQVLDLTTFLTNQIITSSFSAAEPVPVAVQDVPGAQLVRTLDDLLKFKLPDEPRPLSLSMDYDLSVAEERSTTQSTRNLIINQLFHYWAQAGTFLKLTPLNPALSRGIHLIARPRFRIGRSRDPGNAADLITWFLPRNKTNDERTRHLGRVHAVAARRGAALFMWDNDSLGGTTLDGQALPQIDTEGIPETGGEPLIRRARLALGGEYFIDVQPMPSAYDGAPDIKNIRLWNGPQAPLAEARGAVRFTPINSEPSHHDAVWLFTDATFGTSRSNSVITNLPGLSEIQGRFHHYRGCFWVENRVANDSVSINGRAMSGNDIAPLISGLTLQLGQVSFQVEVQA